MKKIYNFQKYNIINEKLGIQFDLIEQGKQMFKEMHQKIGKNIKKFNFIYKSSETDISPKGELEFEVIINDKISQLGIFRYSDREIPKIELKKLDFSTFIHELQHLDYFIKRGFYRDFFSKTKSNLVGIPISSGAKSILDILYFFDDNEFRSRYYDLYNDVDRILKYSQKEGVKIDKQYIMLVIKAQILESTSTFIYTYVNKHYESGKDIYDFLKHYSVVFKMKDIDDLFYKLLKKEDFYKSKFETLPEILVKLLRDLTEMKLISNLKKWTGIYSKEDKLNIQKAKDRLSEMVEKKSKIYSRKITRVYSLMYDKYIKK